ncbi:hypothetical protein [Silvimonas amylolytica]|uniref:Uncharacterized protein n=1 Tax=Silvimonas amylolytica TaxID=449663 RepID=A0ABQ2PN73_9NEIS|nr:hypothetical protein [Silvimonas amylolytica]GGP26761.1 hypothetical protein GCM10010971_25800 [Silvimonas amylolytica]
MSKRRAKNLNDEIINLVTGLLDGWSGKITWDLLIDAIEVRLRTRYTRQALHAHARIKLAYQTTKDRLADSPKVAEPLKLSEAEVVAQTERLKRLEAENRRLQLENERLLEQFVTWVYNAHLKGLTKEFLGRPLPSIDRSVTRLPTTKS